MREKCWQWWLWKPVKIHWCSSLIISLHSAEWVPSYMCTSPHAQLLQCEDVKRPSRHKYSLFFLPCWIFWGCGSVSWTHLASTRLIIRQVQRVWTGSKNRVCQLRDYRVRMLQFIRSIMEIMKSFTEPTGFTKSHESLNTLQELGRPKSNHALLTLFQIVATTTADCEDVLGEK